MCENGCEKLEEHLSVKQIQECGHNLLSFFDKYAQANNIEYYMSGGTLLGAVRHEGFIPWDDDIDLMLPRDDYERLVHSFSDKRYHLSCCECESDYNAPFARLWDTETTLEWNILNEKNIGAFIDLFPIDGFPTGKFRTNMHLFRIRALQAIINSSIRSGFLEGEKHILVRRLIKACFHKGGNYYARRLNFVAIKFSFSKCQYVGVKTTTSKLFLEKNNKNIFDDIVRMPFEDLMLPAPIGYDAYLKHLYGNYMQMPSVESRISKHQFTVMYIK